MYRATTPDQRREDYLAQIIHKFELRFGDGDEILGPLYLEKFRLQALNHARPVACDLRCAEPLASVTRRFWGSRRERW